MEGPSRPQFIKKAHDIQKMQEVWQKTNTVQQLKQNLQDKLKMVVNEDKLDQVLNSTKKQL